MGWILVVDDRADLGADTENALQRAGHDTALVCHSYIGEFYDDLRLNHLPQRVWDVLVLDILFQKDHWGGIWVYNKLVHGGYRDRWNHTIVYSKYAGVTLPSATEGDLFTLRVFADTAGIPFDCVLANVSSGRLPLVEKLRDLGV